MLLEKIDLSNNFQAFSRKTFLQMSLAMVLSEEQLWSSEDYITSKEGVPALRCASAHLPTPTF